MTLKERITEDMKAAMRASDKERLSTIRMVQAAIKQREVDERITLDDAQVIAVLEKMVKQRRESIVQFEQGARQDLADKERAEIALLQAYLPAQLSEAEVDALIREAIAVDRRRVHQGHGQGDGSRQGAGRGPCRHGRRERPHQGRARRLIRPGAASRHFLDSSEICSSRKYPEPTRTAVAYQCSPAAAVRPGPLQ